MSSNLSADLEIKKQLDLQTNSSSSGESQSFWYCNWCCLLVSKPQRPHEESLLLSPTSCGILPGPILLSLTFDGFIASNYHVASGFVIRDELGSPLLVGSKNISHSSVPVA